MKMERTSKSVSCGTVTKTLSFSLCPFLSFRLTLILCPLKMFIVAIKNEENIPKNTLSSLNEVNFNSVINFISKSNSWTISIMVAGIVTENQWKALKIYFYGHFHNKSIRLRRKLCTRFSCSTQSVVKNGCKKLDAWMRKRDVCGRRWKLCMFSGERNHSHLTFRLHSCTISIYIFCSNK